MQEQDEQSPEEYFPNVESFTDCTGQRREFIIELLEQPNGYFLRANEKERSEHEPGYHFAAYSPADPYYALGILRDKIRRGLATRYLVEAGGRRSPGHDRLQGHITYGGVVVDGKLVPFDEFCSMLDTYEGFQFSLTIVDPFDEV